uniref:HDC02718 n=1 Tax=Drosophila melanogaster TaxID=7227 RepID=Q6IHD4_DROME|nr:TPA_inf: HDC02718 [Drosophila melanogaster]
MTMGIFVCRFKDNDIEVKRKDGIILLRELAAEVKNFMDFKRNAVMWLNLSKAQGNGGGPPTLKFEDGTKKHNKTITRGDRTPSPVGHWRKVENNKLPWGQSDCDGGGTGGGESARGRRQIEIKVRPPQAQVFDGARSCCVCVPSSVTGREAPLLAKGLTAGHAHATEDIPILRSLRSVSLCGTPLCPLRVNEVPCYPGNLHGPRWVNNTQ